MQLNPRALICLHTKIVDSLGSLSKAGYSQPAPEDMVFGPIAPFRGKKVGRNEPCPCGSGRKYKRCCGAN